MHVERLATIEELAEASREFLEEREGENNNFLRRIAMLRRTPEAASCTFWLAVNDRPCAAAICRPAGPISLSSGPREAWNTIAPAIHATGFAARSAFGPQEAIRHFAEAWTALSGSTYALTGTYDLFELAEAPPQPTASGSCRLATADDIPLVLAWYHSFCTEVIPKQTPNEAEISGWLQDGHVFLWCDPNPVAMAAYSGFTLHAAVVGRVYTPPEHRARGYAAAIVAAISRRAFDHGHRCCYLFASQANPALKRLYTGIGYRITGACTGCDFR